MIKPLKENSLMDEGEKLELKIRRHYSEWLPAVCDLFAYGVAIGVPWVLGAIQIWEALMK